MADIEITLQPHYGPRFYRSGDGIDVFEHRVDSRNCIGPRPATKVDKENHPKLWAEYLHAVTAELNAGLVGNAPSEAKRKKVR